MPALYFQCNTVANSLKTGICYELSSGTSPHLFTNMGGLSAMCLLFS